MGHVTRFSRSEETDGKQINHFNEIPEGRTAVDNILRVNHGNQMRLGLMADAKANIMITVTSIVFSVTVANLDNEVMKWPLLGFACGKNLRTALLYIQHLLALWMRSLQRILLPAFGQLRPRHPDQFSTW